MDWDQLDGFKYRDEREAVDRLLELHELGEDQRAAIQADSVQLVEQTRRIAGGRLVSGFLQQYSLATEEGIALMCIAEALLRIPDPGTRDRLIAEKIGNAEWQRHLKQSRHFFVNASTWGLVLSGRLVGAEFREEPLTLIARMAARLGEPLIREAITHAVEFMGREFVLGRTIDEAIARARREKLLCSFDMLGEGARTYRDAERHAARYSEAIAKVGNCREGTEPETGHGISVKLSALHPRFEAEQMARVHSELYPTLLVLAERAAGFNLNLTIDAEESDRLLPTLELIERLAGEPALAGWSGLGVVVQAYQKRAVDVIAQLHMLSARSQRRIMVRLVKGAYWDSEIKHAQIEGRPDYPVFTTKAATDVSYLACARRLIEAAPSLYPQFATHNAHTLCAVRQIAGERGECAEFQRLHGMGEPLYRAAARQSVDTFRIRTYAPVGSHKELLPYLVRRLLENGANSSFVHELLDSAVPAEQLVQDPVSKLEGHPHPHPRICAPPAIYTTGCARANPLGRDYTMQGDRQRHTHALERVQFQTLRSGSIIGGALQEGLLQWSVSSPSDHSRTLGTISEVSSLHIADAVCRARAAQPRWNTSGGAERARLLRAMGNALEAEMDELVALLSLEAGKTLKDGVAEVREAIDFCRYYACLAEEQFSGLRPLTGPVGETNAIEWIGRGVFVCISPWNFPLAIFTGQIAAALAAGNAVIAKPAEQTALIAARAVELFHQAGLDPALLALLPGEGKKIGAALVSHRGIDGVAFTGGTETAFAINRALAARAGPIIPLIAETGGLNAMFVDTTALREQVVDNVIQSAFGSAGQRCSALRMLYLPMATSQDTIDALKGACDALVIGDPSDPSTDIGPVIDADARAGLDAHVERLERDAKVLYRKDLGPLREKGSFLGPVIAEVPTPDFLEREVFGPILHIYRYVPGELDEVARRLKARGYGLTLGIHSRIRNFADEIRALVPAGNCYVNRAMTGAVVGVQPFGGEGLSGTGPKAGGPHALLRYATERALTINIAAQGGDPALLNLGY
jgi:RHH-type proline utilization regulon transcriptional repressor/proline dehydrogenase/delta 1-pyrroline-5-carboxylate dehydrogenase